MSRLLEKDMFKLTEKIKTNQAVVGIIGLGYVGLPLLISAVEKGYSTIGFDKDIEKIVKLNNGESYITDLPSNIIKESLESERLTLASEFDQLKNVNVIIICVPTPINDDGNPIVSYIKESVEQIKQFMTPGTLIILESTTYPGTTRDIVYASIKNKEFTVGENYFIAYSPERIDPGNHYFNVGNTPRVVGGITENCAKMAKLFYERILQAEVHTVASPEVAEMGKLLENSYRQVNIALMNELSKVCHTMDVNIWDVIDAASTKPYGFMRFSPGPGVGGHCIPVDPRYLLWAGKQHGVHISLLETANKINESMPNFVVERLKNYLYMKGKKLLGSQIVIIGASYKPNVNDIRESPAQEVIRLLLNEQCDVQVVDPFVKEICNIQTVPLTHTLIRGADGVIILTNHANINYNLIDDHAAFIFDTRQTEFKFTNQNYFLL